MNDQIIFSKEIDKILNLLFMATMTLEKIELRIAEVTASYERQLSLAGKPGYDPSLTEFLKKDLDWLLEQKKQPD